MGETENDDSAAFQDVVLLSALMDRPTRTEYVDRHVTINEHRAPTDESVKLLREMELKAQEKLIAAVQVGNSTFECVLHQQLDNFSDRMMWRAVYKLNGKQLTTTVDTDPRESPNLGSGMRDAFDKLRDAMAKDIAGQVLNDAFVACMREAYSRRYGGSGA
jgi:hypothetical protein